MFESLESRQFMSATLANTATTSITDGTSNTVMTTEATAGRKTGGSQQTYYTVKLEDVLISSYQ